MTPSNLDDDEIHQLLGTALAGTTSQDSPVPSHVRNGSIWVHQFHNMDAELAEAAEFDAAELGARSTTGRTLFFQLPEHDLELTIGESSSTGKSIDGLIAPATGGVVRGTIGGLPINTDLNAQGAFILDEVSGTALLTVSTGGRTVKLAPFQV